MGSINDEIQRVLNPIYGDKSTNHLIRLFRTDHGLLEENLWHNFLQNLDYTGSINDQLYYLFSNFESIFNESTGLYLPEASGNYVSTPNTASIQPSSDFSVVWYGFLFNWDGSSDSTLVSKFGASGTRAWRLYLSTTSIVFQTSSDGTQLYSFNASLSEIPLTDEIPIFLGVTFQSVFDIFSLGTIFYSLDGVSWNIVNGSPNTSTQHTIHSGSDLNIHGRQNGIAGFNESVCYSAQIYDGIGDNSAPGLGTLVAEFDASAPVGPRYRDRTGKIWTINGSAWSWV